MPTNQSKNLIRTHRLSAHNQRDRSLEATGFLALTLRQSSFVEFGN